MKKLFYYTVIFISIFSLSSCDEETLDLLADGLGGSTKLHFGLGPGTGHSFVTVEVLGVSKNASEVGSNIDPCGGGDFVGFAEFSVVQSGSVSYIVFDIEGTRIGSGNITLDSDCILITLN